MGTVEDQLNVSSVEERLESEPAWGPDGPLTPGRLASPARKRRPGGVVKSAVRRAVPDGLYMSFTRDYRLITLMLPVSKLALAIGALRLRRRAGPRGVERLDAVTVINLATRPDRMASFEREMETLRIGEYTRFDAIHDTNGALGCLRSHARCLAEMIEKSKACLMICEDDVRFRVSRAELDVLVEAFLDDPTAEVVCLAYQHCGPPSWHDALFVRAPVVMHTAACYVVKSSIARELLALFDEGIEQLRSGGDPSVYAADRIWSRLRPARVFVLPIKRAAFNADGYSDIGQRVVRFDGRGRVLRSGPGG